MSDILSELARAKVLFQLRAIEAVIHGSAIAAATGTAETGETQAQCEASHSGGCETAASPKTSRPLGTS